MESENNSATQTSVNENSDKFSTKFNPGTYCYHNGFGIGCVQNVDLEQGRIIIKFETQTEPRSIDAGFCAKILTILPKEHIIVEARTNAEDIRKLAKDDPVALVIRILQASPTNQASSLKVKEVLGQALSNFLTQDEFKTWWNGTQKKIKSEARIDCSNDNPSNYTLLETPVATDQKLIQEFFDSATLEQKLAKAAELMKLNLAPADLQPVIEHLNQMLKEATLSPVQQLKACWMRNDLSGSNVATDEQAIVQNKHALLLNILNELSKAEHGRFLSSIKSARSDWEDTLINFCTQSQNINSIDSSFKFLSNNDALTALIKTLKEDLKERTLSKAFVIWLINHNSQYASILSPLLNQQLLTYIFQLINNESVLQKRNCHMDLAELLYKDKSFIETILSTLPSSEIADHLLQLILANQSLSYAKKCSFITRFIRKFPELENTLKDHDTHRKEDELLVSQASLDRLHAEYKKLVEEDIPNNKAAIAKARELGDLSENSEYKMAREDQTVLQAKKVSLERSLNNCRVIKPEDISSDKVSVGTQVVLKSKAGTTTYIIAGAWDGQPEQNILSYQTPFAQALLDKAVGDTVTLPNGTTTTVQSIKPYSI